MRKTLRVLGIVLVIAALLACGPGTCGRHDGCFGDGDFSGDREPNPATTQKK